MIYRVCRPSGKTVRVYESVAYNKARGALVERNFVLEYFPGEELYPSKLDK